MTWTTHYGTKIALITGHIPWHGTYCNHNIFISVSVWKNTVMSWQDVSSDRNHTELSVLKISHSCSESSPGQQYERWGMMQRAENTQHLVLLQRVVSETKRSFFLKEMIFDASSWIRRCRVQFGCQIPVLLYRLVKSSLIFRVLVIDILIFLGCRLSLIKRNNKLHIPLIEQSWTPKLRPLIPRFEVPWTWSVPQ